MNATQLKPDLLAQCQANRKTLLAENAALLAQRDALLAALIDARERLIAASGQTHNACALADIGALIKEAIALAQKGPL